VKLTLAGVLAFIGILYVVLVPAQGLQTPAVKFLPAQGYSPDTVVVRAALHDEALVCAELPRGTVSCRTVGELRKWVQERKAR
jgi:ABC-type cobalamin transport system permease subunit